MKKRIIRLSGVGLVVTLLVSLLIMAAPASAGDPLQWWTEVTPSPGAEILEPCDVTDFAVGDDGETVYAVGGGTIVYKSTNTGGIWTTVDTDEGPKVTVAIDADLVACALDDSSVVAIVDTTAFTVYVSTNGATTWGTLGTPTAAGAANVTAINDIDLSTAYAGTRFVAVSGNTTDGAEVWYRELGIGGAWLQGSVEAGGTRPTSPTNALACAFSPNFGSDLVLTAVTVNATDTFFEVLRLTTTELWNGFTGYPVRLTNTLDGKFSATGASISLAPTYLGGDEVERIAFVGIDAAGNGVNSDGVYRLQDYVAKQILTKRDIYSVAYDGTTCVAGITGANDTGTTVWRCTDPLTTIPTFYPTSGTKSPGGTGNVTLAWAGTSVVSGTWGDESAFSVSIDDGKSFNDISLIDTSIAGIDDIGIAGDGSLAYLVTNDGTTTSNATLKDLSVWRGIGLSWQRVLSIRIDDTTTVYQTYIVRTAPDDFDVVYIAQTANTSVYFGKEGGDSKWYSRASSYNIQDLAVESEDVAYVAVDGAATVSRTTNSGFTWGIAEDTELIAGAIYTIASLSEDNLVVGSDAGFVSYSTDGNESWNKILVPIAANSGNVQITASGLGADDYIYAAVQPSGSTGCVYHWKMDQFPTDPWKPLYDLTSSSNNATGIAYAGGWLYVLSTSNVTTSQFKKTSMPWFPDPGAWMWSTTADVAAAFASKPSALRASSSETSTKLWAASSTALYSYEDTLAPLAPEIIGPPDGTKIKVNPITGYAYDIGFTWNRISKTGKYDLWIAYDPGMMETAIMADGMVAPLPTSSFIIGPTGPEETVMHSSFKLNYMPGTTYYWWIRVADGGPIHSQWSEVRSFTVEAGTTLAPTIGSPENGAMITSVNPAFSWSPVSGATKYEFQLAVSTNFAAALISEQLAETGIRPTVKLDPGMTYFWRVRAVEPIAGDWSTIANFTVAEPEAPPPPPVEVTTTPPPQITVEMPAPEPVPDVILQPPAEEQIAPGYIWAVIIIGAILVIAVIVLIVRTRRSV